MISRRAFIGVAITGVILPYIGFGKSARLSKPTKKIEYDAQLVDELAERLKRHTPKTVTFLGKSQCFKTFDLDEHFLMLSRQLIYGKYQRHDFDYPVYSFDGFIEKYGYVPRVDEVSLDGLITRAWVKRREMESYVWYITDCWWHG